jgi:ATP adenylyltransferase
MVVPNEHLPSLEALDVATRSEMMELLNLSMVVLKEIYHPEGFNIGANIGSAAGAGVADHVHIHVVPRWLGDTNFMSTLGETRILPEELELTYRRVIEAWAKH